jgi:predicted secreted protein
MGSFKRLSFILFAACIFLILDLNNMVAEMEDRRNRKIIVDMTSNGKKIELNRGDEIQIELKSMGGTGYKWCLIELNHDFLELTSEETKVPDEAKGDTVGGPVIRIWKFKARKHGFTRIKMLHYRIWEGKDKPINQFEIEIHIHD